jgi:hypothetical protein
MAEAAHSWADELGVWSVARISTIVFAVTVPGTWGDNMSKEIRYQHQFGRDM